MAIITHYATREFSSCDHRAAVRPIGGPLTSTDGPSVDYDCLMWPDDRVIIKVSWVAGTVDDGHLERTTTRDLFIFFFLFQLFL
jgi:hypothetical protein